LQKDCRTRFQTGHAGSIPATRSSQAVRRAIPLPASALLSGLVTPKVTLPAESKLPPEVPMGDVWGPCSKLPLWSECATILRPICFSSECVHQKALSRRRLCALWHARVCTRTREGSPREKENWPLRSALFSPFAEVEVPVERERNIPKLLKAGSGRVSPLRVFDLSGLRRCCPGQAGLSYSAPVVPVKCRQSWAVASGRNIPFANQSSDPIDIARPRSGPCALVVSGLAFLASLAALFKFPFGNLCREGACFYDLHTFTNVSCHAHA
jgi:hypothetical protein